VVLLLLAGNSVGFFGYGLIIPFEIIYQHAEVCMRPVGFGARPTSATLTLTSHDHQRERWCDLLIPLPPARAKNPKFPSL